MQTDVSPSQTSHGKALLSREKQSTWPPGISYGRTGYTGCVTLAVNDVSPQCPFDRDRIDLEEISSSRQLIGEDRNGEKGI